MQIDLKLWIVKAMTEIFVDSGGAVAYNLKNNEYKKILNQ